MISAVMVLLGSASPVVMVNCGYSEKKIKNKFNVSKVVFQTYSAKICKNPGTISVFQKLWRFVSAHVRAFPTFKPVSKSTNLSRFYYNYSLPASKLGFISNLSHFPSFHVVEFNSSVSK